ncbi:transmembrane protease serine 12-like isoform X2 [Sceloporus undulatus]|uniref:transmembrane protease serine 12-like isoform X2 n=1 Tax=Sceloporus undulatus TaxID=8520 RepID=UPI001C4D8C9A|nr:transmembrane protease serine 12-like isoform X2 [Sceloporus undulatus]
MAPPQSECGKRPVMNELEVGNRIIGGRDAQLGAWPWQVSLQICHPHIREYRHVCGGSLINNNLVLTAAHCIKNYRDPDIWRAVIGLHHLYKDNSYTVKRQVKAILIHSDFQLGTYDNDVALFKLVTFVKYNPYIQPICLPETSLLSDETPCYISGWGKTKENGQGEHILQEAQVDIIPLSICNKFDWYGGAISWNMICAGSESGKVDSCQGDSGGPLVCYFPNVTKYYLIGITSAGIGCGRPKYPGLYVRTVKYRSWIDSHLLNKTISVSIQFVLLFLIAGRMMLHTIL